MVSFTPNMPTASQSLGQTQQKVQDNFTVLRNAAGSADASIGDHADLATGDIGKHKYVHYITQGAAPSTVLTELALYTKTTATGQALFMIRDGFAGTETQLTNSALQACPISNTDGYTFLPGPNTGAILYCWGKVLGTTTGTVTLPGTMFPNNLYNVQTTAFWALAPIPDGAAGISVKILNRTSFQWVFNTNSGSYGSGGFYWTAIGN